MKKLFDGSFDNVLKDAHKKYEQKKSEYGESWKQMSIDELHHGLIDEIKEYLAEYHAGKRYDYDELIDVINRSLMLATRISDDEELVVVLPSYDKGLISFGKKKDLRQKK